MNKQYLNFFILLFFVFITNSCVEKVPVTKSAPDHIRAMYKSDPSTSIAIGWSRFNGKSRDDKLYWSYNDYGDNIDAYENVVTPHYRSNYLRLKSAFVELKNLTPDSKIYFIIENSFGVSKRYYAQTLTDNRDTRLSIIAGGDSRNNRVPRQAANLLVSKLKPHVVLFGGDMTDTGTPAQWFKWFEDWQLTISSDGRVTPILAARGNHEFFNEVLKRLFWLPKGNYYALSLAGGLVRTYVLNSESSVAGKQYKWLVDDLEQNQDVTWKFAQYHKPMRPHVGSKSEGSSEYKYWAPLFYKYRVNLVVESDSHTVKSTWPLRPSTEAGSDEGFIRDDINGTVYVGEGCWGAPIRDANDKKSWTRDAGKFNQFKLIFVDKNEVNIRTVKVDNAKEVGEVSLESRFELPENLELWTPENGAVVTISK